MQKVLILGGSGFVGTAVRNEMSKYSQFDVYSTYFQNPTLLNQDRSLKFDVEDLENVDIILNSLKPDIVVSSLRGDFNKQITGHIKVAEYLKKNGGSLYFFSTSNVFDSDFSRPHDEDDLPKAKSDYGQYKLACEKKIIEILHDDACILRLPQIWGKNSPRMRELLNSLNNSKNIIIYPKLFHNTNTDVMIARQLCYIIQNNLKGIFHLSSEDVANYKDFYCELIAALGFNNAKIEKNSEEEGYFTLISKRTNEFPKNLRSTNKSVIEEMTRTYLQVLK